MEKRSILIVDDSAANIKVLSSILRQEYRILAAKSGEEALECIAKSGTPDLVLLDIVMPGIDGYEVCRRLKEDNKTADVPVVFITAKTDEAEREKGLGLGAAAYITKPFDVETVRRIVGEQAGKGGPNPHDPGL